MHATHEPRCTHPASIHSTSKRGNSNNQVNRPACMLPTHHATRILQAWTAQGKTATANNSHEQCDDPVCMHTPNTPRHTHPASTAQVRNATAGDSHDRHRWATCILPKCTPSRTSYRQPCTSLQLLTTTCTAAYTPQAHVHLCQAPPQQHPRPDNRAAAQPLTSTLQATTVYAAVGKRISMQSRHMART
jgi:hypothetical protein